MGVSTRSIVVWTAHRYTTCYVNNSPKVRADKVVKVAVVVLVVQNYKVSNRLTITIGKVRKN